MPEPLPLAHFDHLVCGIQGQDFRGQPWWGVCPVWEPENIISAFCRWRGFIGFFSPRPAHTAAKCEVMLPLPLQPNENYSPGTYAWLTSWLCGPLNSVFPAGPVDEFLPAPSNLHCDEVRDFQTVFFSATEKFYKYKIPVDQKFTIKGVIIDVVCSLTRHIKLISLQISLQWGKCF